MPGMKWRPVIRKAIGEADYFLALISSNSIEGKGFRNTELDKAIGLLHEYPEDQIYLIPVRLDDCQMPREELGDLHWLDLFPDWDAGIRKLQSIFLQRREHSPISTEYKDDRKAGQLKEFTVSLVDVDASLRILPRMAKKMTELQVYFKFNTKQLVGTWPTTVPIGVLNNFAIHHLSTEFFAGNWCADPDLVVCLTSLPIAFLEDGSLYSNYFSAAHDELDRFIFISTASLEELAHQAGRTFEKSLMYLIVSEIVDYFTNIEYHEETRGCVMDECGLRNDLVKGLEMMSFCSECSNQITPKGVEQAVTSILQWEPL